MIEYINLRLTFEKVNGKEDSYIAKLDSDSSRDLKSIEFDLSLTKPIDETGNFNDYFEKISDQDTRRLSYLETVGQKLYDLIIINDLRKKLEDLYNPPDKKVRLLLDLKKTPELIAVPWELLRNQRQFLIRDGVSIVRCTSGIDEDKLEELDPNRLKVLIVSAAPTVGYDNFDENSYINSLIDIFNRHNIQHKILTQATWQKLTNCLQENEFDIFHFIGHGSFKKDKGSIVLVKENNVNAPEHYSTSDLGSLLRNSKVKFAFLCSCKTGQTSKKNPFRGVAQNLIEAGLPLVLAMQHEIPQDVAKKFVENFYINLLNPNSENIIDEAIEPILIRYDNPAWCIPALYARKRFGEFLASRSDPAAIKNIVSDILRKANKPIIPFLGPGINPSVYIELSNKIMEIVEQKIQKDCGKNDQERKSKKDLIRDIIGLPCSACHYFVCERPRGEKEENRCPMIDEMGKEENKNSQILDLKNEQDLIVAKNNFRCLAQYLFDPYRADDFYYDLRMKCDNRIFEPDGNQCDIHDFFADLQTYISQKKYFDKEYYGLPFPLIVTTCYDKWLEKAFNCEYDVIFYKPNDEESNNLWYWRRINNNDSQQTEKPNLINDDYELDLPITSKLLDKILNTESTSEQMRPIILQLFGRCDNDFVATDNQFNTLIKLLKNHSQSKLLPQQILLILQSGHPLFIGYSLNDPEIHDLIHSLTESQILKCKKNNAWFVSFSSSGKLEKKFLEEHNIQLLRISSWNQFISDIKAEIDNQIKDWKKKK